MWTHSTYSDAVGPEVARMAEVSRSVATTAPVPTCPEWTQADLLRHMGTVHRWATAMVEQLSPRRVNRSELDLGFPDDDRDLADWLLAGGERLTAVLHAADPDAAMWSWGVDQRAGFWSRRMLHETCIHRVDTERAAGIADSQVDPDVASDGIEELLGNLPSAVPFAPTVKELRGNGETLVARAVDVDASWLISLHPEGFAWERTAGGSTPTAGISAPASVLYLVMHRRLPADHPTVERSGDGAVLDHWLDNARL